MENNEVIEPDFSDEPNEPVLIIECSCGWKGEEWELKEIDFHPHKIETFCPQCDKMIILD